MKNLPLLYATLMLFGFTSCQSNEATENKNDRLFASYFVRYLQQENQIKAQATFSEGDSLENARPKTFFGGVSFQGYAMVARDLAGKMIRYNLSRKGAYEERFTFKFKDDRGIYQEEHIEMAPLGPFFVRGTISREHGMNLVAQGSQLERTESLVLLFTDKNNHASSITIEGPTASIEHFIDGRNLAGLTLGQGQLYLVKKKERSGINDYMTVVSAIEFYTAAIDIEIEP